MAIPPFPSRETDFNSPIVRNWFNTVLSEAATVVDSPTVDNFASLDSGGDIKDSGYDATSFAGASHTQGSSTITDFNTTVSALIVSGSIALLGSVTINGQTLTKQSIYTVPVGKTMIVLGVLVRSPSASLAGLVDFYMGGNVAADDWIQQVSLNAFTATTDYGWIFQPEQAPGPPIIPVKKALYAAGSAFGIKINTGSTGPATFIAELWGYLF